MATTEAADDTQLHRADSGIVDGADGETPVVLVHGTGHHPHLARPDEFVRRLLSFWV